MYLFSVTVLHRRGLIIKLGLGVFFFFHSRTRHTKITTQCTCMMMYLNSSTHSHKHTHTHHSLNETTGMTCAPGATTSRQQTQAGP